MDRESSLLALTRAVDVEARTVEAYASTRNKDRHGDVVEPEAFRDTLPIYMANPVLLAGHTTRGFAGEPTVIGKCISAEIDAAGLKTVFQFAKTELAEQYWQLYQGKFMRAFSIGFQPLKWVESQEDGEPRYRFTKVELYEISAVAIPSNRESLVQASFQGLRIPKDVQACVLESMQGEERGVISYAKAHPNGTPKAAKGAEWDGPKEVSAADVDDLKVMCTWFADKGENKGDYKLPHHKAAGQHAVVYRACTAAIAVLNGGRGGAKIPEADRKAVYNHLAKHIREDFEEEAPPLKSLEELQAERQTQTMVIDWFPSPDAHARCIMVSEELVPMIQERLEGINDSLPDLTVEWRKLAHPWAAQAEREQQKRIFADLCAALGIEYRDGMCAGPVLEMAIEAIESHKHSALESAESVIRKAFGA